MAAVLLAAGVAALVVFLRQDTDIPYIPPRPEDSALEYWICDDMAEVDWGGYDQVPGWFGASEFLGRGCQFRRVMESMGCEVETVSEEYIRAVRGDFTFALTAGDSPELTVSVRVEYSEGIIY